MSGYGIIGTAAPTGATMEYDGKAYWQWSIPVGNNGNAGNYSFWATTDNLNDEPLLESLVSDALTYDTDGEVEGDLDGEGPESMFDVFDVPGGGNEGDQDNQDDQDDQDDDDGGDDSGGEGDVGDSL